MRTFDAVHERTSRESRLMVADVFRFGIPSLDRLLGSAGFGAPMALGEGAPASGNPDVARAGFELRARDEAEQLESICVTLIGTDGTGKSLLALHAAAQWLFDTAGRATVLYASTDLSFHRASRAWHDFALGCPNRTEDVFRNIRRSVALKPELHLRELTPYHEEDLFTKDTRKNDPEPLTLSAHFLDLRSYLRGDNWGYLNRMVAGLPATDAQGPLHLLILDGVDGLEASGGELDIFGLQRDRRSRIAQLLRTARRRCHIRLTVAESATTGHTAEAYLADLVIRLRYEQTPDYERRILAVEKARGQGHKRGSHPFFIRTGQRSATGREENPDDPFVQHPSSKGP